MVTMLRWSLVLALLSLLPLLVISRPLQDEEDLELALAPGPPEIISDDDYDSGYQSFDSLLYEYEDSLNETGFLESLAPIEPPVKLNVTAFVSRKAHVGDIGDDTSDGGYDDIIQDLLDIKQRPAASELGLVLTWWQILLLSLACLLVTCTCCYITSCCYLSLDCCSDPYWGCCLCCQPCVQPTKPPPHVHIVSRKVSHSKYSLNENSTAPRTRGSSKSLTFSNKGSNKSVNVVNGAPGGEESSQFNSKERKYSRSNRKLSSGEGEEERLLSGTYPRVQTCANTMASANTLTSGSATLSSVKSVRNYKRTTRPASTLNSDFAKNAGLSESLPHVYKESEGSYFSWLHLFGKSKRRYNVSRRKKKPGANGVQNNNHIYRQTRYRHIAESRNSAVIPTKISKRTSTASTYNTRPHIYMRSRSAETVDSQADTMQPMMETVVSERHIPRSRLSANLAQLESKTAVSAVPEYNLQYFERSLMKSKETTL